MQSISRIVAMTFSRWGIILRSRQMQLTLLGVSLAFGGLAYYQGLLALIRYDSLTSGLVHDSGYAVFALLRIGLVLWRVRPDASACYVLDAESCHFTHSH